MSEQWNSSHRDLLRRADDSEPPEGMESELFARIQKAAQGTDGRPARPDETPAPISPPSAAVGWVKPVLVAAAVSWLGGMATGVWLQKHWLDDDTQPASELPTPAPLPTAPASPPEQRPETPVPEASPAPPMSNDVPRKSAPEPAPRKPPMKEAPPPAVTPPLEGEYELVEQARTALLRGEVALARRALELHRQRFPQGEWIEERAALEIQVALRAGELPLARSLLKAFKEQHPESLLLPALERQVEAR